MDNNQLLQKLKDELINYDRNKSTVNTYLTIAQNFLKSLKNKEFTDSDAIAYLARLREKGLADNSIRFSHYVLRRLFVANKIEFSKRPPPIKTVNKPYFLEDEIQKLIKNAKEFCDEQQKAFLVMSTVYGLRRGEIPKIFKEHINSEDREITRNITIKMEVKENDKIKEKEIMQKEIFPPHSIFISTEKGGIQRPQFIPENLRKYIYNYNWDYELSKATMSALFYIILDKCRFKVEDLPKHSGWHMMRRSAVTYLMQAKVNPISLSRFMRWRSQTTVPGASPMIAIYDRTEGIIADKDVLQIHPFLGLW